MEFPMEIGHIEEIEEHVIETDESEAIVLTQEVTRVAKPSAASGGQKIVYIQTKDGLARAVRVQAPSQVVASPAARSSPVVHRASAASASPANSSIVIKSGSGRTYMVPTPAKQPTATTPKTITMAQAQQMGLLPKTSPNTAAARLLTLNPTIKSEPSPHGSAVATPTTQRVVKVGTPTPSQVGKLKPVTGDSPRVVRVAAGTSAQAGRVVAKATPPPVQYMELAAEEEVEPTVVYQTKQQTPGGNPKGRQLQKETGAQSKQDDSKNVKVTSHIADRLLQLEGSVVIAGSNQAKYVMLPPDYMEQLETKDAIEEEEAQLEESEIVEEDGGSGDIIVQADSPTDMMDVAKKRPCNCTKSQCLKLYCECFANGEFCSDCNCKDCLNSLDHEEERQSAIYSCLERNPNAFRPKIGKAGKTADMMRHHKGCHCKRSGCLKNYCECFEARIPCSENCKCVGCKNSGEHCDYVISSKVGVSAIKRAASGDMEMGAKRNEDDEPPPKQPYNFMTADVVDATVQCMMAQADECQQNGVSTRNTERLILEEFGRCLAEIIDFSNKNVDE